MKLIHKLAAGLGILGLLAAVTFPALAATEGSVSATVTPQLISLTVADGAVAYGTLDANTNKDTITLGDTQTATNSGNVAENFAIRSSDAVSAGTNWNLEATTGTNQYTHEFSTNGGAAYTFFPADNTNTTLVNGVAVGGNQSFDLRIKTPVTSTDTLEHTITVTVQASAAS